LLAVETKIKVRNNFTGFCSVYLLRTPFGRKQSGVGREEGGDEVF
jgi:hypothetical protein